MTHRVAIYLNISAEIGIAVLFQFEQIVSHNLRYYMYATCCRYIVQIWSYSKTEFVLIVLKQQIAKYTTPHSTPLTLLAILASYLMNNSLFLTKSLLLFLYSWTSLYPSLPWFRTASNMYTARCTSPVSVVSQSKLVSGWGLRKRRSAPPYGPLAREGLYLLY